MSFSLALLGASSLSLAAAAADTSEPVTDEITVVGQYLYTDQVNALRSPTPILDVPQSLSVVTSDQIVMQGFSSIGDIIAYTPGVSTSQGEGHRDSVVFRGVRSTADFFLDGVRDDVQYYRPLYNLEQVEILRGPNALLFGRGGTGGILNRVTKKAMPGERFVGYKASVDSFGAGDVQLDGNVTLGDTSALRVNAMAETFANHRDFYDGEQVAINPTFRTTLNGDTTVDLSYEYIDHERFIDRGIPTGADGRPVEAFKDIVFADPQVNTTTFEAHLLRAMVQHQFSDNLKGRFSAFYGDYDKAYQNVYVSDYDEATAPGVVTLDGYRDTTQRENLVLSGDLIGAFSTGRIGHTIVTGVEYIDTANNNDRFNTYFDQTNDDTETFLVQRPLALDGGVGINAAGETTRNDFSVSLADDTHADVVVTSAYLQDEIELTGQLSVILGARYDRFEIDVLNVPAEEARSRTDEEISPRVGLVYKPAENVSLYGSYSESFLPRSGEQYANINGDADKLDPDTFTNTEAGVKWDFAAGLSLTAAVFEVAQRSPQVADENPETLDVVESETTGAELQLQGQVTERWFVSGGYSYLDGEIVDRTGGTGLRPRELPEHMASLWTLFEVTDRVGVGLGATYQDETFIDNANTAVLPAYTRLDASAFYQVTEDVRVQLNLENVTDETYFPNAHSTHQVTVGAPFNASLTVTGRF